MNQGQSNGKEPQMSFKLSEGLATLSAKSKDVEDKVARAQADGKAKIDAHLAEAKSSAEKLKGDFISKAGAAKADVDGKASAAKSAFQGKVAQLKADVEAKKSEIAAKVAARKQAINVKDAEWNYNDAMDYAANCIDWAVIALADVEEAALEVLDAGVRLESVKAGGA
jgi:hypothetical protein